MGKNSNRKKVILFVSGILLFSLLAFSTIVEGNINDDYQSFLNYKNYLQVNRFVITEASYVSKENRAPELTSVVHELDLGLYVFKDSSLLSVYRLMNSKYDRSLELIEVEWDNFMDKYSSGLSKDVEPIKESLARISFELEVTDRVLKNLKNGWKVFYLIVLSGNLLLFVFLLYSIFYLDFGDKTSSKGVMSVRNALIQGQEQERLRISLELHDKVAQDLFACRMIINDITEITKDEGAVSSFYKAISLLDSSIKEVRDLSYSLRPPALQAIGLDSAIQSYIDNFSQKTEVPISFKAIGVANKKIDETVSINLYRILQETLNNTAKHAHAENIDIRLIYTYPFLLLKIEDDGVGFKYVKSEMKAKGRNKLGLPGINERVSLLGGELIINTEKGEGTKILIKVPVESSEEM